MLSKFRKNRNNRILPQSIFYERLSRSRYPGDNDDGNKYIREAFARNPVLFTEWFNKAERNAYRPGFGGHEFSLWIAANTVTIIEKYKIYYCYYCFIDFAKYKDVEIRFEHFLPGLHSVGNIVMSCKGCDQLKSNKTLDYYIPYIVNRKKLKELKPINKHFIPLLLRHYGLNIDKSNIERFYWVNMMKEFALEDFGADINSNSLFDLSMNYGRLFRDRYYKYEA